MRREGPHWLLTAYLVLYSVGIAGILLATHNVGLAVVHVVLLTVGALVLRALAFRVPDG